MRGYHNTTRPHIYSFLKLTFLRQHLSKNETSPSAVVQKAPSGFRGTHSQTHLQCSDRCWVNLTCATLKVSITTTQSSLSSSPPFGHGSSFTNNQALSLYRTVLYKCQRPRSSKEVTLPSRTPSFPDAHELEAISSYDNERQTFASNTWGNLIRYRVAEKMNVFIAGWCVDCHIFPSPLRKPLNSRCSHYLTRIMP